MRNILRPKRKSVDKNKPQKVRHKMDLEVNFTYNHYILVYHIVTFAVVISYLNITNSSLTVIPICLEIA